VVAQREYAKVLLASNATREQDAAQAYEYLKSASLKGDVEANWMVATMALRSSRTDLADGAIAQLQNAAQANFGPAQFDLAIQYLIGKNVPPNKAAAKKWMQYAVMNDVAEACLWFAQRAMNERQSVHETVHWLQEAASLGSASGAAALEQFLKEAGDDASTFDFEEYCLEGFRAAAGQNDLSLEECLELLKKDSERGDIEATMQLAEFFDNGLGVEMNPENATNCYAHAAKLGNAEAQWRLGLRYSVGYDPEKGIADAIEWLKKAAGQDHVDAQVDLARLMRS
jgi:TPR repeat protein